MSESPVVAGPAAFDVSSRVSAYLELAKLRVSSLVLVAVAVGFLLGSGSGDAAVTFWSLLNTVVGTGLVAAGANALNQLLEVEFDGAMERTHLRPLPTGKLSSREVLTFGIACGVVGTLYLSITSALLAAVLAAMTFFLYVVVYTPMKRSTSLCVLVGAIPGALPPVIGWAGATGQVGTGAWILFCIVYFWQLPHFAAIAWQYRDDYLAGGYPMLSVLDESGMRTGLHVMTHTVALIAASLLPAIYGMAGGAYAVGAMVLGLAFLASGAVFCSRMTREGARLHVIASVIYLPLLFGLMLIDRV